MDISKFYIGEDEKPLDNLVCDGGFAAIFRTIGVIGDSLASGEFESKNEGITGYHDFYEYSWGQYMARTLGCTVHNFSRGGMTAKEFNDSFGVTCGAYGYEKLCQAYIIALGVNDCARFSELGNPESAYSERLTPENNQAFLNNYASIIKRIKAKQPDAKFFLVTMPCCTYRSEEEEKKRDLWCEGIRQLASKFKNTYLIDLRKYGPVYDEKFHETFFLGHMRATGYLLTAKMMCSYIDYYIRKYPDDFAEVGFIGTQYKYKR